MFVMLGLYRALHTKYHLFSINYPDFIFLQVAGYQVVYDGLTFATVRGAGHQVPQFQPQRAFTLLKVYLADLF